VTTIGGGIVTDPLPVGRRARPWPLGAPLEMRLRLAVAEAGPHGVDTSSLAVRLGVPPSGVEPLLQSGGEALLRLGGRVFDAKMAAALGDRVVALIRTYHVQHPLEPGASLQSIRAALGASAELVDEVVRARTTTDEVEVAGGVIRLRGWAPRLTGEQQHLLERVRAAIAQAGREPPSVGELAVSLGDGVAPLMRLLERDGSVVQVEEGRYYATQAVAELVGNLRRGMMEGREYGPAELREFLGVTRKYLIPFLEYCDRVGVTDRRGGGRVIRGT
jgi:selenocysteine-specific elongation factor